MALGAMAAAAEAGRPDLSIVGFDDIPAAEARGLTTVRQPLLEKGLTAGRLLIDPPEDPAPREIVLPVELVARASTRRRLGNGLGALVDVGRAEGPQRVPRAVVDRGHVSEWPQAVAATAASIPVVFWNSSMW